MHLNTLSPAPGRIKEGKRCGRGIGSGHWQDWWPWSQRSESPFRWQYSPWV